jgi:hypothetical protein
MIDPFVHSRGIIIFPKAAATSGILQNWSFLSPLYQSFKHGPAIIPAIIKLSQMNSNTPMKMA